MAKPIKSIPVFTGRAAKWLGQYLEGAPRRTKEQARQDREKAGKIKAVPPRNARAD